MDCLFLLSLLSIGNKSEDDEDMEDVVSKPKKLRMKMHADVEEEKIR